MNGPQMFHSESEFLTFLAQWVKEQGFKVLSPDYLTTGLYSPQWRCIDDMYWYRLPNNGKVVAMRDGEAGAYAFNPDGFDIKGAW